MLAQKLSKTNLSKARFWKGHQAMALLLPNSSSMQSFFVLAEDVIPCVLATVPWTQASKTIQTPFSLLKRAPTTYLKYSTDRTLWNHKNHVLQNVTGSVPVPLQKLDAIFEELWHRLVRASDAAKNGYGSYREVEFPRPYVVLEDLAWSFLTEQDFSLNLVLAEEWLCSLDDALCSPVAGVFQGRVGCPAYAADDIGKSLFWYQVNAAAGNDYVFAVSPGQQTIPRKGDRIRVGDELVVAIAASHNVATDGLPKSTLRAYNVLTEWIGKAEARLAAAAWAQNQAKTSPEYVGWLIPYSFVASTVAKNSFPVTIVLDLEACYSQYWEEDYSAFMLPPASQATPSSFSLYSAGGVVFDATPQSLVR